MATFNLIIVSAERKIFEGAVKQIQATGVEGELGILPNHTPLMTAIKPGIVKFTLEDGKEEVANDLAQNLMAKYEDVEVEIHQGNQPVYPYLFSVE